MKYIAAQIQLEKGITQKGIDRHLQCIDMAIASHADAIIFPELSLSGYYPTIIQANVIDVTDGRLAEFKDRSFKSKINIGIGVPVKEGNGIAIGMYFFKPDRSTQIYQKQYYHESEEKWFVSSKKTNHVTINGVSTTIAICYESNIEEHLTQSILHKPEIHLISVVEDMIENKIRIMSDKSKKLKLPMLICNAVGLSGEYLCNGRSCFIDNNGEVLAELNEFEESLLVVDMNAKHVEKISIN